MKKGGGDPEVLAGQAQRRRQGAARRRIILEDDSDEEAEFTEGPRSAAVPAAARGPKPEEDSDADEEEEVDVSVPLRENGGPAEPRGRRQTPVRASKAKAARSYAMRGSSDEDFEPDGGGDRDDDDDDYELDDEEDDKEFPLARSRDSSDEDFVPEPAARPRRARRKPAARGGSRGGRRAPARPKARRRSRAADEMADFIVDDDEVEEEEEEGEDYGASSSSSSEDGAARRRRKRRRKASRPAVLSGFEGDVESDEDAAAFVSPQQLRASRAQEKRSTIKKYTRGGRDRVSADEYDEDEDDFIVADEDVEDDGSAAGSSSSEEEEEGPRGGGASSSEGEAEAFPSPRKAKGGAAYDSEDSEDMIIHQRRQPGAAARAEAEAARAEEERRRRRKKKKKKRRSRERDSEISIHQRLLMSHRLSDANAASRANSVAKVKLKDAFLQYMRMLAAVAIEGAAGAERCGDEGADLSAPGGFLRGCCRKMEKHICTMRESALGSGAWGAKRQALMRVVNQLPNLKYAALFQHEREQLKFEKCALCGRSGASGKQGGVSFRVTLYGYPYSAPEMWEERSWGTWHELLNPRAGLMPEHHAAALRAKAERRRNASGSRSITDFTAGRRAPGEVVVLSSGSEAEAEGAEEEGEDADVERWREECILVGSSCRNRLWQYHNLVHYKYRLLHRIARYLSQSKERLDADEVVADTDFVASEWKRLEKTLSMAANHGAGMRINDNELGEWSDAEDARENMNNFLRRNRRAAPPEDGSEEDAPEAARDRIVDDARAFADSDEEGAAKEEPLEDVEEDEETHGAAAAAADGALLGAAGPPAKPPPAGGTYRLESKLRGRFRDPLQKP